MKYKSLENRLYNPKDGSGFYYWAVLECVDMDDWGYLEEVWNCLHSHCHDLRV